MIGARFFFFFQAEDGIRDVAVTGVQTCALPICTGDTTRATGDLQARLHELRRLGRGLWHLDTIATATPHRDQRRVLRAGRGGPDRHLAPVPLLPPSDARIRRGRSPASPRDSVEIRDA